ncbi:MAG: ribonuclease H-like domain-containing protein [Candidatus Micrarchaeota archaeon]|nr:ribonuclease H-like domain-containing protein [Candidatus Micrarchaeota archaeon]
MGEVELEGVILDASYVIRGSRGIIRLTLKTKDRCYNLLDPSFYPYFYLVPNDETQSITSLMGITAISKENEEIKVRSIETDSVIVGREEKKALRVYLESPRHVPKMSEVFGELGTCYEYDIVFWKRYLIDKSLSPLSINRVKAHEESGEWIIDEIRSTDKQSELPLTYLGFDIETYNPLGIPNELKDPVIMISYTDGKEKRVLTTKKIDREFVRTCKSEKELLQEFVDAIKRIDPDIITGYNSSNFDIPYLMKRAEVQKVDFAIGRHEEGQVKKEHHGLIEAVRVPGRINLDLYNVARFVSVVGASEKVIKVNSFKLPEVYRAITGSEKKMVEKGSIWQQWDRGGKDVEELAEYSLADSLAVDELYKFFLPIEIEMSKVAKTTLGEASISTTSQLVEFMLMGYAQERKQMVPNKPNEGEITMRLANPYEGAYVKTPDAGIYENIAVFDFRGLYPSIIIAHNIDPSTICTDCKDFFVSPNGIRFRKDRQGLMPKLLKMLIDERTEAKKAFKKDPDNKSLAARSTALKIVANAFYGYLGYARSRWYSREAASSITAFARQFILNTIDQAEKLGFRSLYSDTDSVFLLMGSKNKADADTFLKKVNSSLPNTMELELEDFYTRGVFVGKKGAVGGSGAKKKYAMLSESGRIKIKGFELVRRDWSKVARDTQHAVLEAILKEGSQEKAVAIIKDVVERLKSGKMPMSELVIHTQLRKGIGSYDVKSPELAAAKKAIHDGVKRRDELEGAAIGYVITKHGSTISEKAEIEETAKDYDPDYYINHQVIPSTLKILKELGINEEELKGGGAQKRL